MSKEPQVTIEIEPLKCNSNAENNRILTYARKIKQLVDKEEKSTKK